MFRITRTFIVKPEMGMPKPLMYMQCKSGETC